MGGITNLPEIYKGASTVYHMDCIETGSGVLTNTIPEEVTKYIQRNLLPHPEEYTESHITYDPATNVGVVTWTTTGYKTKHRHRQKFTWYPHSNGGFCSFIQ